MISLPINRRFLELSWVVILGAVLLVKAQAAPIMTASEQSSSKLGGRELAFEPANEQGSGPTRFLARGRNYQFLLSANEVRFALFRIETKAVDSPASRHVQLTGHATQGIEARIEFLNANPRARVNGERELQGKVNYIIGNDPARWRTSVPTFETVRVEELYPGIGLVYYGNQQQLEYDFEIAPRADPSAIAMRFIGVDTIEVNGEGDLVLKISGVEIRQPRPRIYQMQGARRVDVKGGYQRGPDGIVQFELGTYDRERPLIIDPRIEYSSYFGGNFGDLGLEIKVDTNGNIYITGETLSTQFPFTVPPKSFQPVFGGGSDTGDAFVAKLDGTGTNLIYLTYLGGSGEDGGYDITIDGAGNAYIGGITQSGDFPVKNALFPKISGVADPTLGIYPSEGFVAELNTNGSALVFSTYLGGSALDLVDGIAIDPAGYIYVTGATASTDFPRVNPLPGQALFSGGAFDAFVARFTPGGTSLVYCTYLGGQAIDEGQGIAADTNGFAFVVGFTGSTNFPITANAFQRLLNLTNATGSLDAFLTKLTPAGALVFSTYLGGTYNDYGYRVTLDDSGNAYVTGPSQSLDFPNTVTNVPGLTRTISTNSFVNFDVFLTKFGPSGERIYSTIFGGTFDDAGWDVAVDRAGNAFLVGGTFSGDFPTTNVFDLLRATNSGIQDAFVAALNSNATALFYSGYLGGSSKDLGYGVAVDAESSAYIVGSTFSTNFPVTLSHLQPSLDGSVDAFIAKIRLRDPMLSATLAGGELQFQWPASAPRYNLESTPSLLPPMNWTPVGGSPILNQGWYLLSISATNAEMLFRLRSP